VNLSQARSRVRSLTNIRSAALLPDANIDEAINLFSAELWDAYNWPQAVGRSSVSVVANTASYAWPSTGRSPLDVRFGGRQLLPLSDAEFAGVDASAVGAPASYWHNVAANTVVLVPSPVEAGTLALTYLTSPPVATTNNICSAFDDEYHMAWCYAAAIAVLRERNGNEAKVSDYAGRLAGIVSRLRRRYLHSQDWAVQPFNNGWVQ
jgi:hypothetical protein